MKRCRCRPRARVYGALWAYNRTLGWHDPREHRSRP